MMCKTDTPRLDVSKSPEFSKTKWFDLADVNLQMFPKFKREAAKKVLDSFFKPARSAGAAQSAKLLSHHSPQDDMNAYLVSPGKKLNLKSISPSDKSFYAGTKEESIAEFDALKNDLQELQKKLYAQNRHRILIVFQAMDAGGKDGCVKHVFSRIDPQGIRVIPFKKPTLEEQSRDFIC